MSRCILYARVSSTEQAERGYSLAGQLDEMREHAALQGWEVVEEVVDPGFERTSLARPGMDRVREVVAAGGADVVLAWRRDRYGVSPYPEMLSVEFGARACSLRALDDSGEGEDAELLDGIKDLIARREIRTTAARSKMGKLRKVREGKLIAVHTPNYGFRYNEARDGYLIDEGTMPVVRRVIREIAGGASINGTVSRLNAEGVPTPESWKTRRGERVLWNKTTIKNLVTSDLYYPHSPDELRKVVPPAVLAGLDASKSYGLWWFGKRHSVRRRVVEDGPGGKVYRRRTTVTHRDKSEQVAVPVPDAGIPADVVEGARAAVADNRSPSSATDRFWPLSGGIIRCAVCGDAMRPHTARRPNGKTHLYYRCTQRYNNGARDCTNTKNVRALDAEAEVWGAIVELAAHPHSMLRRMDDLIARERAKIGGADREAEAWFGRLAALDGQRRRAQDLAIDGLLDRDELRERLDGIEEQRRTAQRELEAAQARTGHIDHLLTIRGAFERYAADCDEFEREVPFPKSGLTKPIWAMGPMAARHREEMRDKTPRERHELYRWFRLRVEADERGGLQVLGAFDGELGVGPMETTSRSA